MNVLLIKGKFPVGVYNKTSLSMAPITTVILILYIEMMLVLLSHTW